MAYFNSRLANIAGSINKVANVQNTFTWRSEHLTTIWHQPRTACGKICLGGGPNAIFSNREERRMILLIMCHSCGNQS